MKLPKSLTTVTPLSKYLAMVLFIALPIVGFYLGMKYEKAINPQVEEISSVVKTNNKIIYITIRNIKTNYSSWQRFKDINGYTFSYPSNWFIVENNGGAAQVQNWDPQKVERPGPLTGNNSKWDISFKLQEFINISDLITKGAASKVEVEKSRTLSGFDCYFITEKEKTADGINTVSGIVMLTNNKYYIWHGYFSSEENLEILKQIVESI